MYNVSFSLYLDTMNLLKQKIDWMLSICDFDGDWRLPESIVSADGWL